MRKPARSILLAAAAATAGTLSLAPPAHAADPNGNNGTVKIDARAFDDAPDNEPHVECRFQVDFYGYDLGDYNADVVFSVQPPTGGFETLLTDTIFIGQDAAGGGTDLDATREYRLQPYLRDYMAHPQQGYHIKLTVHAEGSIGADVKHKVFWVQPCASSGGGSSS